MVTSWAGHVSQGVQAEKELSKRPYSHPSWLLPRLQILREKVHNFRLE